MPSAAFDPTDPDLADAVCRVCEEPASFAAQIGEGPAFLCRVCAHYVEAGDEDAVIARSSDPSEATDHLAASLVGSRDALIAFQIVQDTQLDDWG